MYSKGKVLFLASLAVLLGGGSVNAADEDPRTGTETYYGSGRAERAPEFAEVSIHFSARCLKSAEEVRGSIEKQSAPIWKAIATKVQGFSDLDRRYWDGIEGINAEPDSRIEATQARQTPQGPVAAKVRRLSTCDGKEIALDTPQGYVFSGQQSLGVRSSDLDWVESLVKLVNSLPAGRGVSDVKINVSPISYDVSEATKRKMLVEVQKQARIVATGAGSFFESDAQTLKFKSAHYLGSQRMPSPFYNVATGSPLEAGKAPKVTLNLPFVYTVYAEASDRVDANNTRGVSGLSSEYQVKGTAVTEADYANLSISISAGCLTDRTKALGAITGEAADVSKALNDFHGAKPKSESDRVVANEPTGPSEYYPHQVIRWDDAGQPSAYWDPCTRSEVAKATAPYYSVQQSYQLKSSDFAGLLKLTQELQKKYGVSSTDPTVARVAVSDAVGQLTHAGLQKLLLQARESATACVLDPQGALASDVNAHGFKCAHLKNIRIASDSHRHDAVSKRGGAPRAAMESFEAPQTDLDVVVVKRDGETRPRITLERDYAFQFKFLTEDYVPNLRSPQP